MAAIRVIIADDHPIVREGLKRIIADYDDIELVAEAADGEAVLRQCQQHEPDVLLLDISMPGPGFLQTLKQLNAKHPELQVLVLSINPEDQYAVRAIKAGASGYLTKDHSPKELADAIRHVFSGRKYLTSVLAEELAAELNRDPAEQTHSSLSDREYQILCLYGTGKQSSEIAEKLCLSPKTVSTYRSRILIKMNLSSTAELIRYAVENKLTE